MMQISPDKRLLDALYSGKYGISSPPHGIEFDKMTRTQALNTFRWCMAKMPAMTDWLREQVHTDLKLGAVMNFTPQSLLVLWTWFLSTARIEMMPFDDYIALNAEDETPDPKLTLGFTYETRLIQLFVAMYLGRCFTAASPGLSWDCTISVTSDTVYGQPKLNGFVIDNNCKKSPASFAPYHMVGIQLSRLIHGTASDTDLFSVFKKWMEYLPDRKPRGKQAD